MLNLTQYRLFKKETKYLNSSILVLRDAVSNDIGEADFCNIIDNLDVIIEKTEDMIKAYRDISEFLDGTEICLQINIIFQDVLSLLKILKCSLKVRHTQIDCNDIFNCINVISKHTEKLLEYSAEIAKMQIPNNVEPLW